jgi:hypothetical protein
MGGNKLILSIKLIGESTLEIEFIQWDVRFLSDYKDEKNPKFVYFESSDTEFCMYSHENGYIIDDGQFSLIVPDIDHMKPGFVLSHVFRNDNVRYRFLKTLMEYLPEWANEWETFKNDQKIEHDFIVHNEYWVY